MNMFQILHGTKIWQLTKNSENNKHESITLHLCSVLFSLYDSESDQN